MFLNSHDGSSAYQLRMGLFRVVCTNGMIVSRGAFPAYCVSHRGNVVDEVVAAALNIAERFESLAGQVEHMEHRQLFKHEQHEFADRALALRFEDAALVGMQPSALLAVRRVDDAGSDLWSVLNRVQLCGAPHNWIYVEHILMRSDRVPSLLPPPCTPASPHK